MSVLAEDRQLLNTFILWACGRNVKKSKLLVLEQSLPGEPPDLSEQEAEERGLPDGCIADGDEWALLIESKFAAQPTQDQLRRHVRTARRRGIKDVELLLLTVQPAPARLLHTIAAKQWWEVQTGSSIRLGQTLPGVHRGGRGERGSH